MHEEESTLRTCEVDNERPEGGRECISRVYRFSEITSKNFRQKQRKRDNGHSSAIHVILTCLQFITHPIPIHLRGGRK